MVGTCLVRVIKGWESAPAVLAKLLKFSCLTCVCLDAVLEQVIPQDLR